MEVAVPLPRVTVLATAYDAIRVTDGLRAAGLAVEYWALPGDCSGPEAAALSELASADEEWASLLLSTQVLLTAFQNPQILTAAVLPRVLPYLAPGTLWLQLGAVSDDRCSEIAGAAAKYGLRLLNRPLTWRANGGGLRRQRSVHDREPVAAGHSDDDLLYGLALAALSATGRGREAARQWPVQYTESFAEAEHAMTVAPSAFTLRQASGMLAFQPLSESAIRDLELKELVKNSDLPSLVGGRAKQKRLHSQQPHHRLDPGKEAQMIRHALGEIAAVDIARAQLEEVVPGKIWIARLAEQDTLAASVLVLAPGAEAGEDFGLTPELGYVIDGELKDEYGTYPAGSLWTASPGTKHHPRSETGARILIVHTRT
ncbi:cupin domain-containing protein [Streptomyces sp. NPDC002221]|uniref:cupin domain-containing protein n=1 Tax=Streptomyces sp. NPDC002221 TaxID=3364639 RepID=UPI0036ABB060